jgi:hypothetical protein
MLHVESEVVPSRSRPDRGTVTVRSETVKLLVPRRSKLG